MMSEPSNQSPAQADSSESSRMFVSEHGNDRLGTSLLLPMEGHGIGEAASGQTRVMSPTTEGTNFHNLHVLDSNVATRRDGNDPHVTSLLPADESRHQEHRSTAGGNEPSSLHSATEQISGRRVQSEETSGNQEIRGIDSSVFADGIDTIYTDQVALRNSRTQLQVPQNWRKVEEEGGVTTLVHSHINFGILQNLEASCCKCQMVCAEPSVCAKCGTYGHPVCLLLQRLEGYHF